MNYTKYLILVMITASSIHLYAEEDTDLIKAIQSEDKGEVAKLLAGGADPNEKGLGEKTPLYLAIAKKNYEIMRLLLENTSKPADPNEKKPAEYEPPYLHKAVRSYDTELVDFLLRHKANPDILNDNNVPPIMYAIEKLESFSDDAVHKTQLRTIINSLLVHKADPNRVDSLYGSLLFRAMKKNEWDIARLLIEYGADLNEKFQKWLNYTPLHYAIQFNIELVPFLIAKGANPNIKAQADRTPLQLAEEILSNSDTPGNRKLVNSLKEYTEGFGKSGGATKTPKLVGEQNQPTGDGGLVEALNELARTLGVLKNSLKIL